MIYLGLRVSSPGPIDEESRPPPPKGFVHFHINERVARVAMWINQNFLVGEELEAAASNEIGTGSLELQFASLRKKGEELYFSMSSEGNIVLKSNNMDLCGDVVQALAEYLGLGNCVDIHFIQFLSFNVIILRVSNKDLF